MEIIRGVIPCAKKVVIYGPEGIGKSTFASKFPDPVFIDTEGSTNSMDVARLPKASSWQMLLDQVDYVRTHPTMCKTLVIDHCGVRLITKWCFPRGKHLDGTYRLSKPDTDNLQKLLKDCMTKVGFWDDDALVASEIVEKFWAEVPGIYVRIDRLP